MPGDFCAGFRRTPRLGCLLLISWSFPVSRIPDSSRLVSLADAADHYAVSVKTVRRWISAGRMEGYRVGPRLLRVRLDSLDSASRRLVTA